MASWQVRTVSSSEGKLYTSILEFVYLPSSSFNGMHHATWLIDAFQWWTSTQLPLTQTDPVLATAIPSATSSHVLPWWGFTGVLEKIVLCSGTQWSTMIKIKSSLNCSMKTRVLWLVLSIKSFWLWQVPIQNPDKANVHTSCRLTTQWFERNV